MLTPKFLVLLPARELEAHFTVTQCLPKLGFISVLNRGLDSSQFLESSQALTRAAWLQRPQDGVKSTEAGLCEPCAETIGI